MKKRFILLAVAMVLPLVTACLQYPDRIPNPDSIVDAVDDVVSDVNSEDVTDAVEETVLDAVTDADGESSDTADVADVADVDAVQPCIEGDECDDGDPCTVDDQCDSAGLCAGMFVVECDDGIECTDDSCSSAVDCAHAVKEGFCLVSGVCYEDGTMNVEVFGPCRKCRPEVANDDLSADDTLSCDDGSACFINDRCEGGVCKTTPLVCDDLNSCTDDSCDAVEGCKTTPNTSQCAAARCEGLMFYPAAVCSGSACPSVSPVNCNDENPCTDDSCTLAGCVNTVRNGKICAPAKCEMGTFYSPSACINDFCPPQDSEFCDDGNECTEDYCSIDAGCLARPDNMKVCRPAGCQDLILSPEVKCSNGVCPAAVPRTCDDGNICTDDSCLPSGCVNAANSAPCEDGNKCTLNDRCGSKTCKSGGIRNCDDGLFCTTDQCNPIDGECMNDYSGYCLIDGNCWFDSEVNPDNQCQQCKPFELGDSWSAAFAGVTCAEYENGSATCQAGDCHFECDLNRGDCDGSPANGCETDLLSDPDYCGDCETDCGTQVCSLGSCADTCAPGLDICGGRCVDTTASIEHCGGCNTPCQRDNAVVACSGGECVVTGCRAGYFDVDLEPDNGCECQNTGIELCDDLDNDCNGTTDDVAPEMMLTDALNCGSCGKVCNSGDRTVYGFCGSGNCLEIPCPSNYWDNDKKPDNTCEYFCVFSGSEVCGNSIDEDCDGSTANGC